MLEARRAGAEGEARPVAFYGSSSIRLWETLQQDFPDVELVNLGFGGSTLAACVWFFERIVLPWRPRSLVFYAGDNDLGDGRTAGEVIDSYQLLAAKISAELGRIPFGFIAIKPSPARWHLLDSIRKTNAAIRSDLETRTGGCYVDVFTAMLAEDGTARRELFAEDGLHLSRLGYDVWRAEVNRHRERLF